MGETWRESERGAERREGERIEYGKREGRQQGKIDTEWESRRV